MKITNPDNLPSTILRALENDPYDNGGSDISVTRLLKPPRIALLEARHGAELEESASDRLYALLGSLGHLLVERAAHENAEVETRFLLTGWAGIFLVKRISSRMEPCGISNTAPDGLPPMDANQSGNSS